MGCHFLLQRMKVKSESEVAQSCPTLSDPMDCSLPGSSVHGIFQARVLEWGATAFSVRQGGEASSESSVPTSLSGKARPAGKRQRLGSKESLQMAFPAFVPFLLLLRE